MGQHYAAFLTKHTNKVKYIHFLKSVKFGTEFVYLL
jgi:hypothetical protein